ncbi:hypothetical protein F5887DRAFT_954868 [Amanita rubescens]|nr:hypothetical protein F5887DRAFT_954868 [Amanita rubescens]
MADDPELPSRAAAAASPLRLRPSMTPLGPRGRTRSSAALEPSSPVLSRTTTPDITPTTPKLESQSSIHALVETPLVSKPPSPPPAIKPINKPPPLTIPSSISFESTPVQWKGQPLEAALWTFTSQELQHIVSRSIRASAGESFIRLLSIENLDKVLPAELEKLENAKLMTQSKYRFLVHRRTMLLQGINSRASASVVAKEREESASTISALAVQLSQTVAECDQQVGELAKIYDQQAQISKMLDVHWGSALAIALRKLNSSYGRRTNDLNQSRQRVSQLEAELDDAWKEAERLAQELDAIDAAAAISDGEEEVVISKAAVVSIPQTKEPSVPLPMVPTYFTIEALSRNGSRIALAQAPSLVNAPQKFPESPQMVPSEVTPAMSREPSSASSPITIEEVEEDTEEAPALPPKDNGYVMLSPRSADDAASIKSNKSTKSNKSRVSIVSAARRRSNRVSQSSLRFGHQHKLSFTKPNDAPPVPNLPTSKVSTSKPNRFSASLLSTKSFKASKIFSSNSSSSATSHKAHQSNGSTVKSISSHSSSTAAAPQYKPDDPSSQNVVLDIRKRTSLEDLRIVDSPTSERFSEENEGVTVDDIYIHPRRGTIADPAALNRLSRGMSTDDFNVSGRGNNDPSKEVPSIWRSVDTPTTPAERVESLLRKGPKRNPYNKLKTLTKRYSLPFPLFNASKASAPNSKHHDKSTYD